MRKQSLLAEVNGGVQGIARLDICEEKHLPAERRKSVRLILCGDVMRGPGIDQALAVPASSAREPRKRRADCPG
jgi:hypothetical protein